jgi:hypothetical protein
MGERIRQRVAENPNAEKRQMSNSRWLDAPAGNVANVLRKIEQSQLGKCQYSEYLTLLSSFPDVKKSV